MKKKLTSLIVAMFMVCACVIFGACGDKYKKMEFRIYYAFSENANEWFDGTNGISLNYDPNEIGGDGSSLVFDEGGQATLFVRIGIDGVKSKHLDTISVSSTSISGLNFASQMVNENQVFQIKITGNVNTSLKMYENNSGKNFDVSMVVSRKLTSIEVDPLVKPTIKDETGTRLNLATLKNLIYHPINLTNQIGAEYSIDGIGYYQGGSFISGYIDAESIDDYVQIDGSELKIINGDFLDATAYVVRVRATSVYYNGDVEGVDPIDAVFDVYVVETADEDSSPAVYFNDSNGKRVGYDGEQPIKNPFGEIIAPQINIYENGAMTNDDYSKSTIYVKPATMVKGDSFMLADGSIVKYEPTIFVKNTQGVYEEYIIGDARYESGINGLLVQRGASDNSFVFSIVDRNTLGNDNPRENYTNYIKVAYVLKGLGYVYSDYEIKVVKGILPTVLTINGVQDLEDNAEVYADIVETTSLSYKGLTLKIAANPNISLDQKIGLDYDHDKLEISRVINSSRNEPVADEIKHGDTIIIKFKNNATSADLEIKTLKSPDYYNESGAIAQEFIQVTYRLNKVVTANSFTFYNDPSYSEELQDNDVKFLNAGAEQDYIYVDIDSTGELDAKTVTLTSKNENLVFGNEGKTVCTLNNANARNSGTKYIIPVVIKNNAIINRSEIVISAAEGTNISKTLKVSTVKTVSDLASLEIVAESDLVESFSGGNYFAMARGDRSEFYINGVDADAIASLETLTSDGDNVVEVITSKTSFNVAATIGLTGTEKVKLNVGYYKLDGYIKKEFEQVEIEVAVYNPIASISASKTKDKLAYVNKYYPQVSSLEISFESHGLFGSDVGESVSFNGGSTTKSDASQVKIEIDSWDFLSNKVEFYVGSNKVQSGTVIAALSDKLSVSLKDDITEDNVNSISIKFTALKFGTAYNVSRVVEIPIVEVDKIQTITPTSLTMKQNDEGKRAIELSFIDVEDGGSDSETFDVDFEFKESNNANYHLNIHYDDPSVVLDYVIYKHNVDKNGETTGVGSQTNKSRLGLSYSGKSITVTADKFPGGGWLSLILLAKDSLSNDLDLNNIKYEEITNENSGIVYREIIVQIQDGINTAFSVYEEKDLKYIEKNHDKNFKLEDDITITTLDRPLDCTDTAVVGFEGTLFSSNVNALGVTVDRKYKITYSPAIQSGSSHDYVGLFAQNKGTIENIEFVVNLIDVDSNNNSGLYYGGVVGKNEGTIKNVSVVLNSSVEITADGNIDFGGIAGYSNKTIESSRVLCSDEIEIKTNNNSNVGLVVGFNDTNSKIVGQYENKDDLDSFVYDVNSNLIVVNDSNTINVGSVVGTNNGDVYNLLVGGAISAVYDGSDNAKGNLGGLVGSSSTEIKNVVALALDINMSDINSGNTGVISELNVGGIVGQTSANITNAKFVTVEVVHNKTTRFGQLYGKQNVGGIVGYVDAAASIRIVNSSVESFVNEYLDTTEDPAVTKTFYTIISSSTNSGTLLGNGNATFTKSFANANVKAEVNKIDLQGSYFIGSVPTDGYNNNTEVYSIIDGKVYKNTGSQEVQDFASTFDSDYMEYIEVTDSNKNTVNWDELYTYDSSKGVYAKAINRETGDYYKINNDWFTFANGLFGTNTGWETKLNYNVINYKGVDLPFPYLLDDSDNPIMIVKPEHLSAAIDTQYLVNNNHVHIKKFDYSAYEIKESVIVNFIPDAVDAANTHNLIGGKCSCGGTHDPNNTDCKYDGLIDISLLPEDAQGGYAYKIIVGDGFAHINEKGKIVFTKASGKTPVVVEVWSIFNKKVKAYFALYSQQLFTELQLKSNTIYHNGSSYVIDLYSGQNNKNIALTGINEYVGDYYPTIFKLNNIGNNLKVEITSSENSSTKLDFGGGYDSMFIKIKDGKKADRINEYEIMLIKLYLSKDYFAANYVTEDVLLGQVELIAYIHNSATDIQVDGANVEKTTADDFNFNVKLSTDYVKEEDYNDPDDTKKETAKINSDGEITIDDLADRDGIVINLEVLNGSQEVETLINNVNRKKGTSYKYFAELLDITIISSLYKVGGKTVGYNYDVHFELVDEHVYRYITNNILFRIVIRANSNPNINTEDNIINLLIKPAKATSVEFENYVVKKLEYNTDFSDLIINEDVQTSIVEPGGNGNLMVVYIKPSYAYVTSAILETSTIKVPSLGNKDVGLIYTQAILDERPGSSKYSTYRDSASQVGDYGPINLKLVSKIDSNGNEQYDGVLRVLVGLEKFTGLETTITATLKVECGEGYSIPPRTKNLYTTYLPWAGVSYDGVLNNEKDCYFIQQGTDNNKISITIQGYQFNDNPVIVAKWLESDKYTITPNKPYEMTKDGTAHQLGNYISYSTLDKENCLYDEMNDTYTLTFDLTVYDNIPAPFTLGVNLSLTTKDGQIKTFDSRETEIKLYPTDYVLNGVDSVDAKALVNGKKNIALNRSSNLELSFETKNPNIDNSNEIFKALLAYADKDGNANEKLAKLFEFSKNGTRYGLDQESEHPEFTFKLIGSGDDRKIRITGLNTFNRTIYFKVYYKYVDSDNDGTYKLEFGEGTGYNSHIEFAFTLNIYAVNEENEVVIRSAEELYNSSTGEWLLDPAAKYVLLNDIELSDVVPITTPIASFDGNNRVISIKSFRSNPNTSNYGLFGSIGLYEVTDPETEQIYKYPTILKNVMVDYSKFEGTLALNKLDTEKIVFGGLVAENNGGLIYNCDVLNIDMAKTAKVDVIVGEESDVVFGGLVGINNGSITNSRVGRDSRVIINANENYEESTTRSTGGLRFSIYNKSDEATINQFSIVSGGFVGTNSGKIASSYVHKTDLINYSNNVSLKGNLTGGFVGTNTGDIAYSFAKADDSTISSQNPRSTGYGVEHKGKGIIAGFAHMNSGNITNSYSNNSLITNSAYTAGFVYDNSGTISECYSASTMTASTSGTSAQQPFIGIGSDGLLESSGTIENSFYLMRTDTDYPYDDKTGADYALALNRSNFADSNNLTGFAFVLTSSKDEREEGTWSYYILEGAKRELPELMNASKIAHSYRYVVGEGADAKLINASSYSEGSENNPHIISNADEFNAVFKSLNKDNVAQSNAYVGNVRLIDDIEFTKDIAIQTSLNFTLGSSKNKTSIEGNNMIIKGVHLNVEDPNSAGTKIGLFSEIENAYVKNLDIEFASPADASGFFSSTAMKYSGGLAGTIKDSAIINIDLRRNSSGNSPTLAGNNFVGGIAGLISGNSLIYGIKTNVNVVAGAKSTSLYYNKKDYADLSSNVKYEDYLGSLSYAGAIAGVLDLNDRDDIDFNVQYVDVLGSDMSDAPTGFSNIQASYAGGVAGYASFGTRALRLRYFTGNNEKIEGTFAAGGLFGVSMGQITASQVTAEETVQFGYDAKIGEYVTALSKSPTEAKLSDFGNQALINGSKYLGGLVGLGLNTTIKASYAKASMATVDSAADVVVGGLIGSSVASMATYSYAIPYVNYSAKMKDVGGLIGSAYGVKPVHVDRNNIEYETLVKKYIETGSDRNTIIQSTYSTLLIDNKAKTTGTNLDYICPNFKDSTTSYLSSGGTTTLMFVYAGMVSYSDNRVTNLAGGAKSIDSSKLFNLGTLDQATAFKDIFAGWSSVAYWNLNPDKYYPLLINENPDNYIEIDDESDLILLSIYPKAQFKVIKDITINGDDYGNYIVTEIFRGTIIGEVKGNNTNSRPKININKSLTAINGSGAGFFAETNNATISNLIINWIEPIRAVSNAHVTSVGAFIDEDTGSHISNIDVNVISSTIIDTSATSSSIGRFGGIVADARGTEISSSTFTGTVNASIQGANIGGLVGEATESTMVATATVGTSDKAFAMNLRVLGIGSNNVGGAVGYIKDSSISSVKVAGVEYTNNKTSSITISSLSEMNMPLNVGGLFGNGAESIISGNQASTKINIYGNSTGGVMVGGVAGSYAGGTEDSRRISATHAKSEISTYDSYTCKLTANSESVMISTGVASLAGGTIEQCLFTGSINTENSSIKNLYVGGAVGYAGLETSTSTVQQVSTDVNIISGTNATNQLFVGGIVGYNKGELKINHSNSWGAIIPIVASQKTCYAGGLIGGCDAKVTVNNSYTTSSIIADSIPGDALASLHYGGLVGGKNITTHTDVPLVFTDVYYSSDYALCADENIGQDNNPIGTNLSGQTIMFDNVWHRGLNGTTSNWASKFLTGGKYSMPHLYSLTSAMISFGLLDGDQKYAAGSAMNPIEIDNSGYTLNTEFTYYLLTSVSGDISGTLKGIIIGNDADHNSESKEERFRESLTYDGKVVVDDIDEHSAISNIHVYVNSAISTQGIISNINNGVIFNCSVQGTGLTSSVTHEMGLIANGNNGLISHCYSSAEITSIAGKMSGIAYNNNTNGKLMSSYFTGYINNDGNEVAGIVHTNTGIVYNNYMAGVITKIKGLNAFVYSAGGTFVNNFIDSYVDMKYNGGTAGLNKVSTGNLMSNSVNLNGAWHTTFNSSYKKLKNPNPTFGFNYNYPIYQFNKMISNGTDFAVKDHKNSLYTGIGADGNTDLGTRYTNVLLSDSDTYFNAMKIPHLGVLSSIHGMVETSRNYVLIYDIDGNYSDDIDNPVTTEWKSVGANDEVNGFASVGGFQGLFVTNKNYDFESADGTLTITNLNTNGLFDRSDDAYFGSINLGSFADLEDSGALGNTAGDVTVNTVKFEEESKITPHYEDSNPEGEYIGGLFGLINGGSVTIKSFESYDEGDHKVTIEFVDINSKFDIGLIAGHMQGNATLTLESGGNYYSKFNGGNYVGGLIGKVLDDTAAVSLLTTGAEPATNNSIIVVDNKLNLVGHSSKVDYSIKILGGIVGYVGGKLAIGDSNDTEVVFAIGCHYTAESFGGIVGYSIAETTIKNTKLSAGKSDLKNIQIHSSSEIGSRYYGLIAGYTEKSLDVDGFEVDSSSENKIEKLQIECVNSSTADRVDNMTTTGAGIFVGALGGGSLDISFKGFEFVLDAGIKSTGVKDTPNVGGFVGFANVSNGASINIDETDMSSKFEVIGSINVGGLAGYLFGDLANNIFFGTKVIASGSGTGTATLSSPGTGAAASPEPSAWLTKNGFATVIVGENNINVGGMFGRWDGGNTAAVNVINENRLAYATTMEDAAVSTTFAHNIGGVAGKLVSTSVVNLTNMADIKEKEEPTGSTGSGTGTATLSGSGTGTAGGSEPGVSIVKKVSSSITAFIADNGEIDITNGVRKAIFVHGVNVGGVIGYAKGGETALKESGEVEITDADCTIKQIINNAETISGYQNVGGLVGYSDGESSDATKTSKITIKNEDSIGNSGGVVKLGYDSTENKISGGTAVADKAITGDIVGVISVGGAVGLSRESEISLVYSNANVYGNANVGGLVGYLYNSVLSNNWIEPAKSATATLTTTTTNPLLVKGIHYIYNSAIKKKDGTYEDTTEKHISIPTGVGGLVGYAIAEDDAVDIGIENNILNNVKVTSVEETARVASDADLKSVNTIENLMVDVDTNKNDFLKADCKYEHKIRNGSDYNGTTKFDSIKSGYGGFIGTIDSKTMENVDNSSGTMNYMIDIDIDVPVGVNVGVYYGVYLATAKHFNTPYIIDADNKILIDGVYNIGGYIGFVNGSPDSDGDFSIFNDANRYGFGSGIDIEIQSRRTGMYVGSLIGKTNANSITALHLSGAEYVKPIISTDNCFYVGGLIGRAEVSGSVNLVNLFVSKQAPSSSDHFEDGRKYQPYYDVGEGNGAYAATTDTVEIGGENKEVITGFTESAGGSYAKITDYTDFIASDNDDKENVGGLIGLLKIAKCGSATVNVNGYHTLPFTINTIENSNYEEGETKFDAKNENSTLNLYAQAYYVNKDKITVSASYDTDLYKTGATNPFNASYIGWAKEYTMFKAMQRCIPATDNNGAEWDSLGLVFDAERIAGVGLVERADIDLTDNDDDNIILKPGLTTLPNIHYTFGYNSEDDIGKIKYTIYEETEGYPMLYTKLFIGTPLTADGENLLTWDDADDGKVETVSGGEMTSQKPIATALRSKGLLTQSNIDGAYNSDKNNYSGPTDYWQPVLSGGEDGCMTIYKYEGSSKEDSSKKVKLLNSGGAFVDVFKYKNKETLFYREMEYGSPAASGLLFDVNGNAPKIECATTSEKDPSGWGWWVLGGVLIVAGIVLCCVFPPAGAAAVAGGGVMVTSMGVVGVVFITTKVVVSSVILFASFVALALTGIAIIISKIIEAVNLSRAVATENFFKTQYQTMGYLSSTYSREIEFENGVLVYNTDDYEVFKDASYQPYSYIRPDDYEEHKYILLKLEEKREEGEDSSKYYIDPNNRTYMSLADYNAEVKGTASISDEDGNSVNVKTVEVGGVTYVAQENYIFKQGFYWVNILNATFIDQPSYDVIDLGDNANEYYTSGGIAYKAGTYSSGTYSFKLANGGYVTGATQNGDQYTYTINYYDGGGKDFDYTVTLDRALVEKTFAYDSESGTAADGYTTVTGAYYTFNGEELGKTKYASFTHSETKPDGEGFDGYKGITWFEYDAYKYTEDPDGDYYKDSTTGEFIYDDSAAGAEKYIREKVTYYYKLDTNATLLDAPGSLEDQYDEPINSDGADADGIVWEYAGEYLMKQVYAPVHPISTENPYPTGQYTNVAKPDSCLYKISTEGKVKHKVEYFLSISGFKVNTDGNIFTEIPESDHEYKITVYKDDGDGEFDSEDLTHTDTIENIVKDYRGNDTDGYWYLDQAFSAKVSEVYILETATKADGTGTYNVIRMKQPQYKINEEYELITSWEAKTGETYSGTRYAVSGGTYTESASGTYKRSDIFGLITKTYVIYDSGDSTGEKYKNSLYCSYRNPTDPKKSFYTRYMYSKNGVSYPKDGLSLNSTWIKTPDDPDTAENELVYYKLFIDGSGWPNENKTRLIETVKVTLTAEKFNPSFSSGGSGDAYGSVKCQ